TGKVTCTLYGHPGVAQMDAGRQVGRPAIWTGTPAAVTLKPGATAHAVLTVHNAGALCSKPQTSTYLNVIAPRPADRLPGPVPVARLSRHVGDARCPGQTRRRRAVLHLFLTAFPAPTALLPHYSCHGAGYPFRYRSRWIPQVPGPAQSPVSQQAGVVRCTGVTAQDAQQAVLLVVDAGGEPERVGAAGCRGTGQQAPQARLGERLAGGGIADLAGYLVRVAS